MQELATKGEILLTNISMFVAKSWNVYSAL